MLEREKKTNGAFYTSDDIAGVAAYGLANPENLFTGGAVTNSFGMIIRDESLGASFPIFTEEYDPTIPGNFYASDTFEIVKNLYLEALQNCIMKNIVMDAFVDKPEWILFLEKLGFVKQRSFIRMCLGNLNNKGITLKQYAIAGPEIG